MDNLLKPKPRKSQMRCPEKNDAHFGEKRLLEMTRSLTERVKELACLYGISHLFEDEKLSTEDILKGVINVMPPAWQYPEITCARIKYGGKEFTTLNFKETEWRQSQNIMGDGKIFGVIEVYYLEQRPKLDEGPFLKETQSASSC
jgi:hypothetical protein